MMTLICCISFALISTTLAHDQLILLQAIWRHGDRSPSGTCKGDPNKENKWPLGWGQLTPLGMQQHIRLGNIIYDRYVNKLNFLSSQYSPWEFYIRSTDNNRTVQSAMANFIGFYYNRVNASKIEGIDYPKNPAWPAGYIPVPVHTYNYDIDYVGEPNLPCPRQKWLWSEAQKTPEYQDFFNSSQPILEELSEICQEKIDMKGAWTPFDAFFCEKQHNMAPPVNDTFFNQLQQMEWTVGGYLDGIGLKPYDGFDFKIELGKLRGGTILWDIIGHMDFKHDSTIRALLGALDANEKVVNGHIPQYSSAMLFELWNTTNGLGLKVLYHRNYSEWKLEDITSFLDGCSNLVDGYCPFAKFRESAIVYYPGNSTALCYNTKDKKTSFYPDQTTTSTLKPKSANDIHFSVLLLLTLLCQLHL